MVDSIRTWLTRLKWDVSFYISSMRVDIIRLSIVFVLGLICGIVISLKPEVYRISIIHNIIIGEYSVFSTFLRANLYIGFFLLIVSFTGFLKIYRLIHYIVIFIWSLRLGMDIILVSNGFMGILSLIIIYVPYYLSSICLLIALIVHIRIIIPSPRVNWWCFSRSIMGGLLRECMILMTFALFINLILFIINPLIIQVFAIIL